MNAHLQSHDTTCRCGPVTKYEVSIVNGCGDIFDEKVLRNYGRTDGRTDKFESSILNSCGDIFDENLERKKKE